MITSFSKYWRNSVPYSEKNREKIHNHSSFVVIFANFVPQIFQKYLISAEILKLCWNSQILRNSANYLKITLISADKIILTSKCPISTKVQRKCDYFTEKIQEIVCHDPQIRSIFPIIKKRANSTNFDSKSPKCESSPRGGGDGSHLSLNLAHGLWD